MAHTELSRTPSGAGNRKTYTISFWVKRSELSTQNVLFSVDGGTNNTNYMEMSFNGSDQLSIGGYTSYFLTTNRKFRDTSAWYHIVWRVDTTQSTADDRFRLYVNGTQETSFSQRNNPSQNDDTAANMAAATKIGQTLDGYLAQYIMADGQSYAPTTFGSTNSNGVWIPNASPSVTYGTNGFKLDFKLSGTSADASGFGADSSGQTNHFATTNIATNPNTKDSPENVFATLDPNNDRTQGGFTFSLGNMKVVTSGSNRNYACLTQAFTSGKWYMECKFTSDVTHAYVGFCDMSDLQMDGTSALGNQSNEAAVGSTGYYEKNNSVTSGWAGTFATNDILGLCLDCDNNRFTLSKNGQFADGSGNYDEANPTAYITYTAGNFMTFALGEGTGGATATCEINTGNSPYAITSGNADANGYGNFEYAVPSGYYALCTKNLAQYG
tara:strand:+ start:32 stop:1351 length:1320 start_codon:yes stop_codon:yes gene_type:complete